MSHRANSTASNKHKNVLSFVNLSISVPAVDAPTKEVTQSSSLGLFPGQKVRDSGNRELLSPTYAGRTRDEHHHNARDEGLQKYATRQEDEGLLLKCNSLPTFSVKLAVEKKPLQSFMTEPSKSIVNNKLAASYRPNSSHQYLSPVELRDSTVAETNIRLGKPTRTTLLRDRYRRRSLSNIQRGWDIPESAKTPKKAVRSSCGSLSNLLSSLASDNNETTHGFLTGARYNRSDFIEQLLSRDQSCLQIHGRNTPPATVHHNSTIDIASSLLICPESSLDMYVDESKLSSDSSDDDTTLPSASSTNHNTVGSPQFIRPRSALRRNGNQLAAVTSNVHRKPVADVQQSYSVTRGSERNATASLFDQSRAKTANLSNRKPPISASYGRPTTAKSPNLRTMRLCPSPYSVTSHDAPGIVPLAETEHDDDTMSAITIMAESNTLKLNSGEKLALFTRNQTSVAETGKDYDTESDRQADLPNFGELLSREDTIQLEDIESKSCNETESIRYDKNVPTGVVDSAEKFFMTEQERIQHKESNN